jgi:hypothetical protein
LYNAKCECPIELLVQCLIINSITSLYAPMIFLTKNKGEGT